MYSKRNIITDEDEIIKILEQTFHLFFQKSSDWDDFNKDLQNLTHIRDDVMHQHPMSLADLGDLHKLECNIEGILNHTKKKAFWAGTCTSSKRYRRDYQTTSSSE